MPTHREELDRVLVYIVDRPFDEFTHSDIMQDLKMSYAMAQRYMGYMENHGYIMPSKREPHGSWFTTTIEGYSFSQQGGYTGLVKRLKREQRRENWKTAAHVSQVILTLVIAVWAVLVEMQ